MVKSKTLISQTRAPEICRKIKLLFQVKLWICWKIKELCVFETKVVGMWSDFEKIVTTKNWTTLHEVDGISETVHIMSFNSEGVYPFFEGTIRIEGVQGFCTACKAMLSHLLWPC